ncbi:cytochrome b/b6 domain-containing protein [Thiothrix winogradskyi]|uniref:Cytochrome b/b6 domain-containing protein n=1 Tax=Thiothrix winogradskyi TaxID=96472 RepID=A0ABY3T0Y4_9GAMM|nr:cytochrome b/b6 domain-containing protein [Thiothrix winogradskyi]UJS24405.1 cytochrome b/b6 domain-containing protein [Thiothrix winogradskyi]
MQQETIRYVLVWSGWVRLAHALIAAGVLFLLASACALQQGVVDPEFWRDWHMIVGQLVLVAVVGRVILLFLLPGTANWRAFLPDKAQWAAMRQMALFYLSFARFPLPNWYGHNPFWRVIYPLFWLVLLVCAVTGLFYNAPYQFLGMSMFGLHGGLASLILWFTLAHVVAVVLHDLKGKGASISGIINGYRYFHVETPVAAVKPPPSGKASITHVSIASIQKPPKP